MSHRLSQHSYHAEDRARLWTFACENAMVLPAGDPTRG